jgi:hypothetical protein
MKILLLCNVKYTRAGRESANSKIILARFCGRGREGAGILWWFDWQIFVTLLGLDCL